MDVILENNGEDDQPLIAKNVNSSAFIVKGGPTGSPYVESVPASRITVSAVSRGSLLLKKELMNALDVHAKGAFLGAIASFVVMELCGSFLTGDTGDKQSSRNFKKFCESDYMPSDYHKISDLLYIVFRCGVAHSYIVKGAAHLGENVADGANHLKFYQNGLYIHVPTLANDVKNGLDKLYSELDISKYKLVLEKLHNEGEKYYKIFIEDNKISLEPEEIKGDKIPYID